MINKKRFEKIMFLASLVMLIFPVCIFPGETGKKPANIRNIASYVGVLKSEYETDNQDMNDESVMTGIYMQWINPELFQVNSFIYGSGDNFGETFIGLHMMGDFYIRHPENGKWAIGSGFEYLKPDVDTSTEESGTVTSVDIENSIYIPFIRAGRYFNFNIGESSSFSLFHWAGYQMVISRGEGEAVIDVNGAGFPPPIEKSIDTDDETSYAITGVKLGLNIMHVIDLIFKYKASMNHEDFFNTIDTMANFYFTRNLGISFRHKFMENKFTEIDYSIFGISYSF